jgi:Polyketide cyclase / dehydrase and lipid transport
MRTHEIDITASLDASPDALFAWLGDSTSWPDWTPIDQCEIVHPGDRAGLGEVRVFTNGRFKVREAIVERVSGRRLTYTLLDGLPLRDYRAEIDLSPEGDGTRLRWHTTFSSKRPGLGWAYRRALRKATRQFIDGLAAVAAREPR